jgi:hypothetical protein
MLDCRITLKLNICTISNATRAMVKMCSHRYGKLVSAKVCCRSHSGCGGCSAADQAVRYCRTGSGLPGQPLRGSTTRCAGAGGGGAEAVMYQATQALSQVCWQQVFGH